LFWLREAQIVNFCMAATEPSVGLSLNEDDMRYKIYLNDTGLLLSHAFSEDQRSLNELYRKLMLGKLELNKGMLVENLVAQMLRATGKKLFFFATNDPNNKENTMEIDFLIRKPQITNKHNISPIEVKSTQKYSFSSLTRFMTKYTNFAATPYIVHSGEFKIYESFVYLPLYMTPLL